MGLTMWEAPGFALGANYVYGFDALHSASLGLFFREKAMTNQYGTTEGSPNYKHDVISQFAIPVMFRIGRTKAGSIFLSRWRICGLLH